MRDAKPITTSRPCMYKRAIILTSFIIVLSASLVFIIGNPHALKGQSASGVSDLDLMLVIDESGSMLASDPNTWRIKSAELLAQILGVDQAGSHHRLGVIMFGTSPLLVRPLSDIQSPAAQQQFSQTVNENHTDMGFTNITATLRLAKSELDKGRSDPNVKRAVIFLSDGYCQMKDPMSDEDIKGCDREIRKIVQDDFVQAGYPIFTIALNTAAFGTTGDIYKNLWQEIATQTHGEYFEAVSSDKDLVKDYVSILQRLFGLPVDGGPTNGQAPITVPITLEDGLLQVTFAIVKDNPGIQATIVRPDGTELHQGDPDVDISGSNTSDTYSVNKPVAGTWLVKLSGQGNVSIFKIKKPSKRFTIERLRPLAVHPQGKPMNVAVRVLDENGKSILPQRFDLSVTLPDSATVAVPLSTGNAMYSLTARIDNTQREGAYTLQFSGKQDAVEFADRQTVNVVKAPWLQLIEPRPGTDYPVGAPVEVTLQLMFNTDAIYMMPDKNDQLEVTLRLIQPDGQLVPNQAQILKLQNGGVYSGVVRVDSPGDYLVRALLTLEKSSGEKSQDISEASIHFSIKPTDIPTLTPIATLTRAAPTSTPVPPTSTPVPPTFTPTPTPAPPPPCATPECIEQQTTSTILIILAVLGILGGGGFFAYWYSLPSMDNTLLSLGGGEERSLSGKRKKVIGSDLRSDIVLSASEVELKHAELRPTGDRNNPHVEIRSINPSNPAYVNGAAVTYPRILEDGEEIRIGQQVMTFKRS